MPSRIPRLGTWNVSGQTQTAGTAIVGGVPPWPGRRSARPLYNATTKNWLANGGAVTRCTSFTLNEGSTAHSFVFMRPLNYTTVTLAAAAGATTLTLAGDPGVFSTNFNYPLPGGLTYPLNVADDGIVANDYVALQLADGTWQFIKVTSVAAGPPIVLTIPALPSPTGAGNVVNAGALLYFFGVSTDTDPNTGAAQPTIQPNVSVQSSLVSEDGLVAALHAGDPLMFYDANATAADTLAQAAGYYGKY